MRNLIILSVILTSASIWAPLLRTTSPGGMPQQAYVWQHVWNTSLKQALHERAGYFSGIVVLAAEVDASEQASSLTIRQPDIDYNTLRALHRPVGLAVRVNALPAVTAEQTETLALLANTLIRQAQNAGLTVSELQWDYDAPTAKLAAYQSWLKLIRQRIAPIPLTFTALPDWLGNKAFETLLNSADSFILQVHSLDKQNLAGAKATLCDTQQAWTAIVRAAGYGQPFRVALPTHSYRITYTEDGQMAALAAEGSSVFSPEIHWRELHANPVELAGLVKRLQAEAPTELRGIIWYRLPVDEDQLNWRWPTLHAVMQGREPLGGVKVVPHASADGLIDIEIVANGELDLLVPPVLKISWDNSRLQAADGLHGYQITTSQQQLHLQPKTSGTPTVWLAAGQRRWIAWLRFNHTTGITIHVESKS